METKMKKIEIKGKDYIPVNERIKEFWKLHENWCISTEIVSHENGIIIMKACLTDDQNIIRSTGHAYEKEDSTFINKTSYIENCETSAVGRALGNIGIGIDTSIASFEEVANAVLQQDEKKWMNDNTYGKYEKRIIAGEFGFGKDNYIKFIKKCEDSFKINKDYRNKIEGLFTDDFNKALAS